jgi:hypothetical protein
MVPEFPQHDLDARQGEEALVGFNQPVMPDQDAALKTEPCVRPLNDVAQAIAMRTRVLSKFRPAATRSSIVALRDDGRDSALPKRGAERAAVVSAIRQETPWPRSASSATPSADRDSSKDAVCQLQFMDVGPFKSEGDRRSASVDEDRSFRSLANLGDTDTATPFFAAAKLASRIPCESFRRPRLPSCPSRTRRTRVQTPSRCQRTSLSQQVEGAPYSRGMSSQRQPVFRTNSIPLMVRRSSTLRRPIRFFRGSSGWMSLQSLSDRSVSRIKAPSRRRSQTLVHFKELRRAMLEWF